MSITLGNHDFAATLVSTTEQHEETGGRDARVITLTGLLRDLPGLPALEAALDAVLAAASEGQVVPLRLRPGRVLRVRRTGYSREVQRDAGIARFVLKLEAEDPFEYALDPESIAWALDAPDAARDFDVAGNVAAWPRIDLVAAATLLRPGFSDGLNALRYDGSLPAGQTLQFDGDARRLLLDGEDVTPYSLGRFPALAPGTGALAFLQDGAEALPGTATVSWHARWW
jgi:hypothetical protein